MCFLNKNLILTFIYFIVGCLAASTPIGMKILVISTGEPESMIKSLQSYSIEYDYLEYNVEHPLVGNLPLYTEDNQPKYYGIVLGNGSLSVYFEEEDDWGSILSEKQWSYLREYQRKYGIRIVALDDGPDEEYGTEIADSKFWGIESVQQMKIADNDMARAIFKEAGIKETAEIDTTSLYHVPVKIISKDAIPIMTFQPNSEFKKESVAVAYYKDKYGCERLSFFIGFGDWSLNSVMLNHLWISWITRSLYAGERHVTFTPHIDDVFLSTGRINYETGELEGSKNAYRSTVEDFEDLKKWQDSIVDELPEGSFIRCEVAFNGNGIVSTIDPSKALEVDGERYCDIEYIKEPGTGKDRWPSFNWTLPYDSKYLRKDDLFAYFEKEENNKNFFFSSHTFTHENLDEATTSDVDNEIRNNIEIAKLLGIHGKSNWSGKSIITPQISGLRNADALTVFKKYGIVSGTGDLSRPIVNEENPYLPFFTTKESSNYEGFPIIPRTPTEVYYSSANTEENTFIYNMIYGEEVGETTWDQILEREIDRTLTLMLNLRNEAHQFHQINIRSRENDEDGNKSILQIWCTAVLKKYTSYVDWPVESLKLDDQAQLYIDRYNRIENCEVSKNLILDGDYITGVEVTPKKIKKDCKIPITVPKNVYKDKKDTKITYEKRGNDHLVAWVSFEEGDSESKTIKLNPPLAWANGAIQGEEVPEKDDEEEKPAETCWSETLGYRCCKDNENIVQYIDEDGWWGVTNDEQPDWCGIVKNEKCWAENFGLPCCESEDLDFVHDNGVIGYEEKYENDESRPAGGWCGIKSAVDRVNSDAIDLFRDQLGF
jgi:hypothetical protein